MNYDLNDPDVVSVFDECPIWAAPFGLKLLESVHLKKNISALDIGFGTGFPLLELAQRLGSSSKVYGLDPWKAASERAKKKIEICGVKNAELIEGVAENIPLPDNSIDLIVSNNGLNNVSDLDRSLAECARVAKKKAQLVLSFNLDSSMKEFYSVFEKVLKEKGLNGSARKMKEHIYSKRKPVREWRTLLRAHKFRVRQVRRHSFSYKFMDGTAMLNHYFIRLAFRDSWESLVPDANRAEVFSQVEKQLNKQAEKNKELKLSVPFVIINCIKN